LDKLKDTDVTVEIYYGDVDPYDRITNGRVTDMKCSGKLEGGIYQFEGEIYCDKTGQQGFTVRAIPTHPDLHDKHETALVIWA
jgi:starch phosphorylase